MSRTKTTARARVTRRIVALATMAVLAYPVGTTATLRWVADHDNVDIPYVRDCHGLFRHPQECSGASRA